MSKVIRSEKKILWGCLGCSGFSLIIFIIMIVLAISKAHYNTEIKKPFIGTWAYCTNTIDGSMNIYLLLKDSGVFNITTCGEKTSRGNWKVLNTSSRSKPILLEEFGQTTKALYYSSTNINGQKILTKDNMIFTKISDDPLILWKKGSYANSSW